MPVKEVSKAGCRTLCISLSSLQNNLIITLTLSEFKEIFILQFLVVVQFWAAFLDGESLLDVKSQNVTVVGDDLEFHSRGNLKVLVAVVLARC